MSNSLSRCFGHFNCNGFSSRFWREANAVLKSFSALKTNTGVTLVELIVAISIIAVMAVLAIPNLRRFTEVQTLNADAGRIQTMIRQAQSNAQSGVTCASDKQIASNWKVIFYGTIGSYNFSLRGTCQDGNIDVRQVVALNNNTTPQFTTNQVVCTIPPDLQAFNLPAVPTVEFRRDLTNKWSVDYNCYSGDTELSNGSTYQINLINGLLGVSQAKNIIVNASGSVEVQ